MNKRAPDVPRVRKPSDGNRRENILLAAQRRFAELGFGVTTVRQIAGDVDMLAGSLYHHFATKEDMLHDIVAEPIVRLRDAAARIAAQSDDPERRLVAVIFADVREMTSSQQVHAILNQERAFFRRNPDFAYVVDARRAHYLAWRAIIEDGIRQSLFDPDMNIYLTISTIIRMLNTGADWYAHDEQAKPEEYGRMPVDELCAFYVNFVLHAVRAPGRAAAPIPSPSAPEGPAEG